MKKVCATLLALLVCVPVLADEAAFPSAPRDMKGAEAAKLERVTFDELKQLFPGTHDQKGFRGKLSTKDFLSGGKMKVSGAMQGTGTWRLDSKEGGIYCSEFGLGRGSRGPWSTASRSSGPATAFITSTTT